MEAGAREVVFGKVSDVPRGKGKTFVVEGAEIAVFNVDGTFYAIDNTCAHLGGPLGEGILMGCTVTCPWHSWEYDVRTGEATMGEGCVRSFPVRVDGDSLVLTAPPGPLAATGS
jgi:nitrite reductase/ring-hydroxylating ferredoxin subunit